MTNFTIGLLSLAALLTFVFIVFNQLLQQEETIQKQGNGSNLQEWWSSSNNHQSGPLQFQNFQGLACRYSSLPNEQQKLDL